MSVDFQLIFLRRQSFLQQTQQMGTGFLAPEVLSIASRKMLASNLPLGVQRIGITSFKNRLPLRKD